MEQSETKSAFYSSPQWGRARCACRHREKGTTRDARRGQEEGLRVTNEHLEAEIFMTLMARGAILFSVTVSSASISSWEL